MKAFICWRTWIYELYKFKSRRTSTVQEPEACATIVHAGLAFLKCYARLATLAWELGRPLWKYTPRVHYFHHMVLQLDTAQRGNNAALNPLTFSCSAAEDFVGRVSLLSRRVSARTIDVRVIQRWLAGAMSRWQESAS